LAALQFFVGGGFKEAAQGAATILL